MEQVFKIELSDKQIVEICQRVTAALIAEFKEKEQIKEKEEKLITAQEYAEKLQISQPTLWRWAKQGIVNPIKMGRKVFYRANDTPEKAKQNL